MPNSERIIRAMERSVEEWLEAIEGRLEENDPEAALQLAKEGMKSYPEVPDLHALAGDALWMMGDVRGAGDLYERAVEILPGAPDLLAGLARIRFSLCDFFGAHRLAREALKSEENGDALDVLSRLAERSGRLEDADRLAARAFLVEEDVFPKPLRVSEEKFQEAVEEAVGWLPQRFREAIRRRNVAILVEPFPSEEILLEEEPPLDPTLLGLYRGIPLLERTSDSQRLPDTIHLFQRNIERVAGDREGLVQEIAITVYHELGHFFGLDEDELEDLDLG